MKRSSTARAEPQQTDDDGLGADLSKMKVRGRGLGVNKKMSPRTLREALGITQVELAKRLKMDQSQVSKLEAGEDHLVTTLQRYAEALGGELQIAIMLSGQRYRIG
jgi:ribosome-binding protein aMBF1 (putative translation factor)